MYIDFKEAADFLRSCDDAAIVIHRSPDGDCIGSGYALKEILTQLGKRSKVVCSDEIPERYSFLVKNDDADFEPKSVIAVDIADKKLMGGLAEIYGGCTQLCIDHHISNTDYAEKTLLNGKAAAACEVIFDLAEYMGLTLTTHCAKCLYTGLATDSGCFRFSNTSPHTHETAAKLMAYDGIDFALINRKMFEVKSRIRVKIESRLNEISEEYSDGKLMIIGVTQSLINELGVAEEEFEGFANVTIQFEETEVGVLMRERENGEIRCSFRSSYDVDVSEICRNFGGGGHSKAAGCTFNCSMDEAKKLVAEAVERAVSE